MRKKPDGKRTGLIFAILIPFIALGVQWVLWPYIAPFVWFFFFPAVFFSARLGGLRGGLAATLLSIVMVWYFFIPPQLSWEVANPSNLYSVGLFLVMGYLFSDSQERLNAAYRRTKVTLSETEEHNRTTLYSIGDCVITTDAGGRLWQMNPAAEKITGWSEAEANGKPIGDVFRIVNEDTRQEVEDPVGRILREGKVAGLANHTLLITRDGREVPIADSGAPIRNPQGEITGVVLVFRDQTAERAAAEALLASEARYRHTLDAMLEGCQIIGLDWRYLYLNDVADKHNRRSKEELLGKKYMDMWPGIESTQVFAVIRRCMEERLAQSMENKFTFPDGSQGWFELRIYPVPEGIVILSIDITERKRADETIRSLARFPAENPNPVLRIALDGSLLYGNQAAFELLAEWKLEVGKPAPEVLKSQAIEVLGIQKAITVEIPCGKRVFSIAVSPAPEGEDVNLYARDVTERTQVEAEIHKLNVELEQRVHDRTVQLEATNQELEAFAYSVSHDLRAPLRALDGFSAVLLTGYSDKLDEQGRHYIDRIRSASQRMGQLIEDLLGLSRVTRSTLNYQPVDLSALAHEIAAELQKRDPQRQAEFIIAPQMTAETDPHLLRIALQNLLDNAWKFTGKREAARIEVGWLTIADFRSLHADWVTHLPESAISNPESAIYFVRDNGVGFDMAYADKLFTPFQRLHSMQEFPGTGIGLATVQRIAARHGGRAWAEAQVDKGATFYFTLGGT